MHFVLFLCLMILSIACSEETPGPAEDAKKPGASETSPARPPESVPAPEPMPPVPAPPEAAEAVQDDGTTVVVALTGNDSLQYNLKEIRVADGRTIRLTLTHIGIGAKESMGHNFVLLAPGTEVTAFGLKAASARETGFIPPTEAGSVLANTAVVGGGESITIEFPAPAPGVYDYICSFTGHFGTMRGKLIVQ